MKNMKKIIFSALSLLTLSSLSACSTVNPNNTIATNAAVEREYPTGSLIPRKKGVRSINDAKSISGEDASINQGRAMTPFDPLGKK